jgi:hypothetical protein
MFYVWLAFALAGFIKPAWRWFLKQRAGNWPLAEGKINSAQSEEPENFWGFIGSRRGQNNFVPAIVYSYSIDGQEYSSRYVGDVVTEEEAQEFCRDLNGKPVMVHYNPDKPSSSALAISSVQHLQQTRLPAVAKIDLSRMVPAWSVPFIWLFAALSLIGLALSLFVHINSFFSTELPPITWALHVGIFVVWFPAILVAQRRVGTTRSKNFWKLALKGSPDWMLYAFYVISGYAVLNFIIFMTHVSPKESGSSPQPDMGHVFSGHWLIFYSAAFAILYSAAVSANAGPRCMNGHLLPPGETTCPECGQPISSVE